MIMKMLMKCMTGIPIKKCQIDQKVQIFSDTLQVILTLNSTHLGTGTDASTSVTIESSNTTSMENAPATK